MGHHTRRGGRIDAAPFLKNVTLSVALGEKIGLVGRNGCGKTSLLKTLAGELAQEVEETSRRRGLRIGYRNDQWTGGLRAF
jgi:ATPase subunit of ABC transporter with duplicated ATPase domains